jgi:glycosyltransferase involved in cell wall biosynthesis
MNTTIKLDNIIFELQDNGGASLYWRELTYRIKKDSRFDVEFINGSKYTRLAPVLSNSDVFHSSHFRTSFFGRSKIVSTIHDLAYETGVVSGSRFGNKLNIWQRNNAIKYANAIVCISENTKQEMIRIYPHAASKPIHVIHHGSSFDRLKIISIRETNRLIAFAEPLEKFVLYVGTRSSYKNFNSALIGFATSTLPKNNFFLICTGSRLNATENELIQKLGVSKKVLVIDSASQIELQYLYQNAFSLIYPSTYEGFGLPPLEAMSSGSPVIAANRSSIPEVVNDAGILIDEIENPETIKNSLETLLDEEVRNTYITKGLERAKLFTWEKSASQHMQIYLDLANSNY